MRCSLIVMYISCENLKTDDAPKMEKEPEKKHSSFREEKEEIIGGEMFGVYHESVP